MDLYHLHIKNKYDEIWQEGNEITVNDRFKNGILESINSFNICE